MPGFIEQLGRALLDKYGKDLGEICVVFPSKRACVFLEAELARISPTSSWSPQILAIEDFITQLVPSRMLDTLSLTFELWPLYHKLFSHETFDSYYSWGQLIVQDFEEVDLHLIDGEKIFQNLAELKRIDTSIDSWLNEDGEPSEQQRQFMRFWEGLGKLYTQLDMRLRAEGHTSMGRALRRLSVELAKEKPALKWRRVIFAGFNALAPAEEAMVTALMKWDLAECYWDMDAWYVDREEQEAGRFFRALRKRWEAQGLANGWKWIGEALATQPKQMVVTAVPKRVGQAKAAGLLLESLPEGVAPESVAVVLPDENLLFPILHSLPESLKDVNVTMGYPLRNTPLYGLIDILLTLHENAARLRPGSDAEQVYYFRDVVAILRHPYVHSLANEEARETMRLITQENMIYIAPGYFLRYAPDHILRFIFTPWDGLGTAIEHLLAVFMRLKGAFEARQRAENPLPTVETEVLYQCHTLTKRLQDKLSKYLEQRELGTFIRIYREVLVGASLPFAGEPLKGIQVMGMLETRVLDFEHLIILSVNEDIIPPKQQQNTLIPYGIRKAFGLPTFEDKDAVYAYHFYRLIQRAGHVQLVYDTEPDSLGGGEKSRFLAQIEAELCQVNPELIVEHGTFTFPMLPESNPPIVVEKQPDLIQKLLVFGQEKGFSPSALNTYLECSLRFYFRYLLQLREKSVPEETMEDNTFGSVLHGALEQLYQPYIGATVERDVIASLMPKVDAAVESVFKITTHSDNVTTGRNRLLLGVIKDLVRQMLEMDMEAAPIDIMGLEEELEATVVTRHHPDGLKIKGFVDRIDRAQGRTRIIDYKTGQVERIRISNFMELKEGKPKREAFQLGTYAYLYHRNHHPDKAVYPGIFAMRNLQEGFMTLEYGPAAAQ
ncbi:MAG: PD-(D/E)XK nuclease family protein [Bacteroidia bacterium]